MPAGMPALPGERGTRAQKPKDPVRPEVKPPDNPKPEVSVESISQELQAETERERKTVVLAFRGFMLLLLVTSVLLFFPWPFREKTVIQVLIDIIQGS
jgi:hypothetical protein